MTEIPQRLRQESFRFIKVKTGDKIPLEKNWQKHNNYHFNDPILLTHINDGGNYGILGGFGNLAVIDCDAESISDAVLAGLPSTFTVKTPRGGRHYYYLCPDIDKTIRLLGGSKPGEIGDIKAKGGQVVGPGSIHPKGGTYEIERDEEIATVSWDDILNALSPFLKPAIPKALEKLDDSQEVLVRAQADFAHYKKGQIIITQEKYAKTWVHSGSAAYIKDDEFPYSILKDPDLFDKITDQEFNKKIVGELEARQTIFLCACGMFVEDCQLSSYNLGVDSESGAGKDHVTDSVLKIFPEDRGEKRTRISEKALNYWHCAEKEPEWTWDGKYCYLPDISKDVLNSDAMKLMSSEGSTTTIVDRGKAVDLTIRGKPVFFITSASRSVTKEMQRRFPLVTLDETIEQTKAIMRLQIQLAKEGRTPQYDPQIREALGFLRRVKVKVPFGEKFLDVLPAKHIIMRTHLNRFLDLIKASAALHQYQRHRDKDGFVIADPKDYDCARIALLKTTSNIFMVPLQKNRQKFLEIAKEREAWWTIPEISPAIPFLSERALYTIVDDLKENFLEVRKRDVEKSKPPMEYRVLDYGMTDVPVWDDIEEYQKNASITPFTSSASITSITSKNTLRPYSEKNEKKEIRLSEVSEVNEANFVHANPQKIVQDLITEHKEIDYSKLMYQAEKLGIDEEKGHSALEELIHKGYIEERPDRLRVYRPVVHGG